MTNLTLHPKMAPSGRLRVWIGVCDVTSAPPLSWQLDGQPAEPKPLHPLQSARPEAMVDAVAPRVFTGVYEFADSVEPGRLHRIRAAAAGAEDSVDVRSLPDSLPDKFDRPFNVLLASCFYRGESRNVLGTYLAQLTDVRRPDLTILVGDQVYLDLPSLRTVRRGLGWHLGLVDLAARFEKDYRANWVSAGGYTDMLNCAPTVCLPDDHEYWNNYPHPAAQVPVSYSAAGRDTWSRAARALFEAFQAPYPEGLEAAPVLDVDPVSFFFLDTRTHRREDRSACVHPKVLKQFENWCDRVGNAGLFGILVTGQPLSDPPTSTLTGKLIDRTLADYADFGTIVSRLRDLAAAGRPVVLLTGDVHWGRVTAARDESGLGLVEIISSPASLVTTFGRDTAREALASLRKRFLGRESFWPRHSDPLDPAAYFAKEALGGRFATQKLAGITGDQMALLSFRRSGFGVELEITYFTMPDGEAAEPIRVGKIRLRPDR